MSKVAIQLPDHVYESQLPRFLASLDAGEQADAVGIDISKVKFLMPAAVVAVLARCHRWKREGRSLSLTGIKECENLRYLQRIDFLHHLGIDYPETFVRHPAAHRFVPVQTLNFATGSVDKIASEITTCVLPGTAPDDDVFQALQYSCGELLSNSKYHSAGRGFVCAQFFPARNLVRIAVADDGGGIRGSFTGTSREAEAGTADAAIRLALLPGVSSALLRTVPQPYGGQNHRGVGLSITRELTKEARGQFTIVTEDGWFDEFAGSEKSPPKIPISFPGTLVAISLHRDHIADYAAMHEAAISEIGLGNLDSDAMFLE